LSFDADGPNRAAALTLKKEVKKNEVLATQKESDFIPHQTSKRQPQSRPKEVIQNLRRAKPPGTRRLGSRQSTSPARNQQQHRHQSARHPNRARQKKFCSVLHFKNAKNFLKKQKEKLQQKTKQKLKAIPTAYSPTLPHRRLPLFLPKRTTRVGEGRGASNPQKTVKPNKNRLFSTTYKNLQNRVP
jgi:hypothetical protein